MRHLREHMRRRRSNYERVHCLELRQCAHLSMLVDPDGAPLSSALHELMMTLCPVSDENVRGRTNSSAPGVITTCTSTPCCCSSRTSTAPCTRQPRRVHPPSLAEACRSWTTAHVHLRALSRISVQPFFPANVMPDSCMRRSALTVPRASSCASDRRPGSSAPSDRHARRTAARRSPHPCRTPRIAIAGCKWPFRGWS